MDYELFDEEDATIENEGNLLGVNWLDDEGIVTGTEYFATEDDRQEAIDKWYADTQDFTPEQ